MGQFTMPEYLRILDTDTTMDATAILQLDPAAYHNPSLAPELCLLAAVVQLALRDLQKHQHRAEAREFIESVDLDLFCDWLDWDVEAVRQAATEGVAAQSI